MGVDFCFSLCFDVFRSSGPESVCLVSILQEWRRMFHPRGSFYTVWLDKCDPVSASVSLPWTSLEELDRRRKQAVLNARLREESTRLRFTSHASEG